ncbi:cholecystokinin receptor type A-like [Patiria miniata]|uniref:G-protein coupled receptors family 1 profile domain-containing protein n=1 Tax=Patiria miniata TaxID=46514 RepID=A0A913ZE74_PATMI|nr:cholecystokinin receptor type A-like [Patiria miniata]
MADTNGSSVTWPFISKLEVTRWAEFTLWLTTFCLGVPANLMILGVCCSRRLRTTTQIFIAALATADLLICLLRLVDAIAIASVSHYLDFDSESVVYFLSMGLLYTTALLITAIAFDRFDTVCRSLNRLVTIRRAKIIAAACFVAGYIGVIPEAAYKLHQGLALHHHEIDTFHRALLKFLPICMYILSLTAVTILYSAIFIFLHKRQKNVEPELTQHRLRICAISDQIQREVAPSTSAPLGTIEERQHDSTSTGAGGSEGVKNAARCASGYPSTSTSRVGVIQVGTDAQSMDSTSSRANNQEAKRFRKPEAGIHHPTAQGRPQRRNIAQSRITRMLFIATFMLFILWLPYLTLRIYALGSLYVDFLKSSHHASVVAAMLVFRDVVYLNSVINVFVYGLANKRFREDCNVIVRKLRQRF